VIVAEKQLPDAELDLARAESEYTRLEAHAGQLEATLPAPRNFPVELAANDDQRVDKQTAISEKRQTISTLESQRGELTARLQAAQDAASEADRLEGEQRVQARRVVVLGALVGAFGKSGIPALLLDTALPQLQAAANEVLGTITDGQMALEIRTQRETVSGGLTESLSIVVFEGGYERDYSTYSGGEKARIDLALRAGLSEFLTARAGARCETLVLDEIAEHVDQEHRAMLCGAIARLAERYSLVLCISHCRDVIDAFPTQIAVSRGAEGSRVEVLHG
jgi:DNA repair protein SbcC/Rad50